LSFPLYLDEDVSIELGALLHQLDCDVLTTRDAGRANQKLSDEDQLAFASANGRAIFTHDYVDYEIISKSWSESGRDHFGIIVSERTGPRELRDRMLQLFDDFPEGIPNLFLRLPKLP
jgi:hypothetical protein